jgi:hypothetical protein
MQYIRSQLQAHVFVSHVIGSWLSNFDLKEKIYYGWGSRIMLGNLQIYILCRLFLEEHTGYTAVAWWWNKWVFLVDEQKLETTMLELFAFNNRLCYA